MISSLQSGKCMWYVQNSWKVNNNSVYAIHKLIHMSDFKDR